MPKFIRGDRVVHVRGLNSFRGHATYLRPPTVGAQNETFAIVRPDVPHGGARPTTNLDGSPVTENGYWVHDAEIRRVDPNA